MGTKKDQPEGELTNHPNVSTPDFENWNSAFQSDYIVQTHHHYAIDAIPQIEPLFEEVIAKYGTDYPELIVIQELFRQLGNELLLHMRKEELVLFPFVKKLVDAETNGTSIDPPGFGSVKAPISVMKMEHETTSLMQEKLSRLGNGYVPPKGANKAFCELYDRLKEFDRDLSCHVYEEDNILFPKVIALEKLLLKN